MKTKQIDVDTFTASMELIVTASDWIDKLVKKHGGSYADVSDAVEEIQIEAKSWLEWIK